MSLLAELHAAKKARDGRFKEAARALEEKIAARIRINEHPSREPATPELPKPIPDWLTNREHDRDFEKQPLLIQEVQRLVAKHCGITRNDIVCQRRAPSVTQPRQIAMALAKTVTANSFPEIGRHTGGRDHTTAMHAARKIERMRADNHGFDMLISFFEKEIENAGQKFR